MTQPEQKIHERACLDQVLDLLEIKAENIEQRKPSEPPDFTFELSGRKIAVEHTDFYTAESGTGGRRHQEIEEAWANLMDLVWQDQPDLHGWSGIVRLKQPPDFPRKNTWPAFLEELRTSAIDATEAAVDGEEISFRPRSPLLSEFISEVVLRRAEGAVGWATDLHVGSVGLKEGDLSETIRRKANATRLTGCEEFWLLICTGWQHSRNPGRVSLQAVRDDTSSIELLRRSQFDRAILYVWRHSRVLEWDRELGWKILVGDQYWGSPSSQSSSLNPLSRHGDSPLVGPNGS